MYIMKYAGHVADRDPAPAFESGTGFLLARLGSLAGRRWVGLLRRHELTPHQHGVLLVLRERGPLGQQDLGRVIAVDPRNVVPILDGLVDQGLIRRSIDASDRRRRILELTEDGGKTADGLAVSAAALEREFVAGLAPEDQAELNRLLGALHASLAG